MKNIQYSKLQTLFYNFYQSLTNKQNIFYIFFSTGMLMFLRHNLSYLSKNNNIVLIGGGLSDDEIVWLEKYCDYPRFLFHDPLVSDREIWNILLQTNRYNFGWIDVDCFIYDNDLLNDLSCIKTDTAFNCYWQYDFFNVKLVNTYLLFVNIDIYRKINIPSNYFAYNIRDSDIPKQEIIIPIEHKYYKLAAEIVPIGIYPYNGFFDTLIFYQIISQAKHYKVNLLRKVKCAGHVGGSSFISKIFLSNFSIEYDFFSYISICIAVSLLNKYHSELPSSYNILFEYLKEIVKNIHYDERVMLKRYYKKNNIIDDLIEKFN